MKEKCCANCEHLYYQIISSNTSDYQEMPIGAYCGTSARYIPSNAMCEFSCNLFEKKRSIDEIKRMAKDIEEC